MSSADLGSPGADELRNRNRQFYDSLWSGARVVDPRRFNTWPLVQSLLANGSRRLEVAPGLRPHLPIEGTLFVDISAPALAKLQRLGAKVMQADVASLPFDDGTFDLVGALDIIEHVDNEENALSELARVARDGAALMISAPLHSALWTGFDDLVGHKRRFEPADLQAKLAKYRIEVESSAVFGMKPRSPRLVELGMWWLMNHRETAMHYYNRYFMPLGLFLQKPLQFEAGMIEGDEVDEVLLVCRKRPLPT